MKKQTFHLMIMLFITLLFLEFAPSSWAQVPHKMSYQMVIRNSSDKLIVNQKVGMQISILKGSESGTAVYTETQKPNTNANGLVTIEIGAGTTSDNFTAIDWASGPYYIKTETDPTGGTSYNISGVSQLLSVPYALYAKNVENDKVNDSDSDPANEIQELSKSGNLIALSKGGGAVSIDDSDADPANEIQTLSISGTSLTLSKAGGTVTLPSSSGSADNWGTQTAAVDATLSGNGTTATPLKIAQQSATAGQALKWNGTTWKPGKVDSDSTNEIQALSISGTSLTLSKGGGTVSLPSSGGGDNWGSQTVTTDPSLTGTGTITSPLQLAQQAATNGQVLKWNGTSWVAGNDEVGTEGLTLPYLQTASSEEFAFSITNSNNSAIIGVANSGNSYVTGVRGETSSPSGQGVSGIANSTNGEGIGVYGVSHATAGYGIFGQNYAASGQNYGVYGISGSVDGTGVYGASYKFGVSGTGITGVMGNSSYLDGKGVYGLATSATGTATGVTGESRAANGTGVSGTGPYTGVNGTSTGTSGIGVSGIGQTGISGIGNTGIQGMGYLNIPNSIGVSALGFYGVSAGTYGPEGYAGYFIGRTVIDGNLGISVAEPVYKLDVAGAANLNSGIGEGAFLNCNGSEAIWFNGTTFSWGFGASNNYFARPISIGTDAGAGYSLTIAENAAKPGGGEWDTWSDIRLKDIQGNYEKGLKEIILLQPVRYNYKKDNACKLPSDKSYTGFVAQDVQKVFPEAVTEGSDGYLKLDANSINVALVNAIKELKAENDELKERLAKLEKLMESAVLK